jgi:hypothetical protein
LNSNKGLDVGCRTNKITGDKNTGDKNQKAGAVENEESDDSDSTRDKKQKAKTVENEERDDPDSVFSQDSSLEFTNNGEWKCQRECKCEKKKKETTSGNVKKESLKRSLTSSFTKVYNAGKPLEVIYTTGTTEDNGAGEMEHKADMTKVVSKKPKSANARGEEKEEIRQRKCESQTH